MAGERVEGVAGSSEDQDTNLTGEPDGGNASAQGGGAAIRRDREDSSTFVSGDREEVSGRTGTGNPSANRGTLTGGDQRGAATTANRPDKG